MTPGNVDYRGIAPSMPATAALPYDVFKWERDLTTSTVSRNARLVGFIIRMHADAGSGMCFLSNERLTDLAGFSEKSRKSVKAARDELVAAGLLEVLPGGGRASSGRGYANTFRLVRTGASDTPSADDSTEQQGVSTNPSKGCQVAPPTYPGTDPPSRETSTSSFSALDLGRVEPESFNESKPEEGTPDLFRNEQVESPEQSNEIEPEDLPDGFDRIGTPEQWRNLKRAVGVDRATVAASTTLLDIAANKTFTEGPLAWCRGMAECFAGRCDGEHGCPEMPHGDIALHSARGRLGDTTAGSDPTYQMTSDSVTA